MAIVDVDYADVSSKYWHHVAHIQCLAAFGRANEGLLRHYAEDPNYPGETTLAAQAELERRRALEE